MNTRTDGKIDKAQVAGVTNDAIFDRHYIRGGYRFIIGHFMLIYGVTARPLGASLLRACSKKQGSEALAHN